MTPKQITMKKRAVDFLAIRCDFENQEPWKERAKKAGYSEKEIEEAEKTIRKEFGIDKDDS